MGVFLFSNQRACRCTSLLHKTCQCRRVFLGIRSCDAQGLLYCFRFSIDHQQVCPRRTFGNSSSLFPMTHRVDAETESDRKLLLRHPQPAPNCSHIDLGGNMNYVLANVCSSLSEGQRLLQSPDHAFADLAHDAHLRLRFNSSKTCASLFRVLISDRSRSSRSFLAYA